MATGRTIRKATIYDIAEASQASAAAVSLVLNGKWRTQRISEETAARINSAARTLGYRANLRARALRLSRSGLIGMIIPHYRNRFFAGLAETFEAEARTRDLCPIVVSTQRDPGIEDAVVRTLLAQQVEALFVVGVKGPERLNRLCRGADVPSINVDLPGNEAPSVVSDNRSGARALTERLVAMASGAQEDTPGTYVFVGGDATDHATSERILGFKAALRAHRIPPKRQRIVACGFSPSASADAIREMMAAHPAAPEGLFVNSITALEGVAAEFARLGLERFQATAIGCNDWDPFGSLLPLRLVMARQNVEAIIEESFGLLHGYDPGDRRRIVIPPEFPDDVRSPAVHDLTTPATDHRQNGRA